MGTKKKPLRRSPKCSARSRFPLGELAREKCNLRDEYLSKSKKLSALKKRNKRLQEKSEKVQECMNQLEITPRSSAFVISKNTSTARKKNPSELSDGGKLNLPRRSAQRRQLETLIAATEINGGSMEDRAPALEGMVSTVLKYSKVTDVAKYLSSSKKLKKATLMEIKKEAQEYEKSNENFIRSLSLLYAGGVIGKVKYMQGRSALVMRHTGKSTKTGTPSVELILKTLSDIFRSILSVTVL